jgi:hypothetical protein
MESSLHEEDALTDTFVIRPASPPRWTETGALLSQLPEECLPPLPRAIRWNGLQLARKAEFHLTIVGRGDMQRMGIVGPDHPAVAEAAGNGIGDDAGIVLLDELWVLQKPGPTGGIETTIATACEAPAMSTIRLRLATATGCRLPLAPPHITLYIRSSAHGIGISDLAALHARRVAHGRWRDFGLSFPRSPIETDASP